MISTDPADGDIPPGVEFDLRTTYCRRTLESDSQVVLHDALNQGWADDPAFEAHGFHCYHGTTLRVNGELYGTVCFVANDPRSEAFSDRETMFAELITRLLERELETQKYKTQLTRQTNLATVLNRVLRHNLRNDMSVIRGFTQLMADKLDGNDAGKKALDNIDDLLALSNKARELERVVAQDFDQTPVELVTLVEDIVDSVVQEYPSASISVESDRNVTTTVLPSFEQAVKELVENAAKHGSEQPTVTITIERQSNDVLIRITDDGPGLDENEMEVLASGTETPLAHGSGLGLWISLWIVTNHDGSINPTVTENGTEMTLTIPQKPDITVSEQKILRARDQYQASFEEAYDAMVLVNDNKRIVDANSQAGVVFGRDSQELLGQAYTEFLPDDFDFEAAWQRFKNTGTERGEETIVSADGVERVVEYSATADVVPGIHLVVSRDVTKRTEYEAEIRNRDRVLREMYDIMADRHRPFADQVGDLLELGRSELDTAYGTLSEIRGDEYVFEVVAADDDSIQAGDMAPLGATNCETVASTGDTVILGDVERDAPGETDRAGYTEWGISCYIGAPVTTDKGLYGTFCFYDTEARAGQFTQWEEILVDLMSRWVSYELQRQQVQDRLQEQNERLERFAGTVSHDLRNPLAVIQGSLKLAEETGKTEHIARADGAATRMQELIEDLLSLARQGDDVAETELAGVELDRIVEDCWQSVPVNTASVRIESSKVIRANEKRLKQLVENLFRNAVEHGGEDVTVRVGEVERGFYIEDDGTGISEENRERVFETGYSTNADGTGYGLSIVQRIVDAHGWDLRLTEGCEGGARFVISGVESLT